MTYDPSKERVEEDGQGEMVRLYHDAELVWHEMYICAKCGWSGEIDRYGRTLANCPECGAERDSGGLDIGRWEEGDWADARDRYRPQQHSDN